MTDASGGTGTGVDGSVQERSGAILAAEAILRPAAGSRLRTSFGLAPLTSFRIGGPAALYLEADSEADLAAAAEAVRATGIPWFALGKGSNVLISDAGFPGLVIRLGKGYRWVSRDGHRLHSGAAMPLPALTNVALSHGLTGIEFGVAIPGSVGGAVRMNAGAHGRSMSDVLMDVDLYSILETRPRTIPASEVGYRYRHSELPTGSVVVGATVALRKGDQAEVRRAMEEAREYRRATQPLAEPNCGSVFKNPPGDHAARLVEAAGGKSLSAGPAIVSAKHANFIVAAPGSTAKDVRRLIGMVQARVQDRFGVLLEPEVQFVGDFDRPTS